MVSEMTIQQQQALAMARARKRKAMAAPQADGESQFDVRNKNIDNIVALNREGKISTPSAVLQSAGQVAGGAGDIVMNAVSAPFKAADAVLPESVTGPIKRGASKVVNTIAESPIVKTVSEKYSDLKEAHPELVGDVEAVANIGALVTPVKGKSVASIAGNSVKTTLKPVVKGTVKAGKNTKDYVSDSARLVKKGFSARTPEELGAASHAMKEASGNLFRQSREAGAVFNKNRASNMVKMIDTAVSDSGKLNAKLHGDTLSVLSDLKKTVKKGPLSLEELHQYRQLLNDVVSKNTDGIKGMNPDAFKASRAIDALDDQVENLAKIDIVGGKIEAVDALRQGMDEWKRFRKFESVSNIIKQSDGDPNRLKAGLQRFVNKPKNLRGFTHDEKIALRKAAKNTAPEMILKAFGKFGFDLGGSMTAGNTALPALAIGGGVAGIPGGIPMAIIGTGARQAQKWTGRGKAEDVLKLIEGDKN